MGIPSQPSPRGAQVRYVMRNLAFVLVPYPDALPPKEESFMYFLKKNMNASRPSEHPTHGGKSQNA